MKHLIIMKSLFRWHRRIRISTFCAIRSWERDVHRSNSRLKRWKNLRKRNILKNGRMNWQNCIRKQEWQQSVWRNAMIWSCGSVRASMCLRLWNWRCSTSHWHHPNRKNMTTDLNMKKIRAMKMTKIWQIRWKKIRFRWQERLHRQLRRKKYRSLRRKHQKLMSRKTLRKMDLKSRTRLQSRNQNGRNRRSEPICLWEKLWVESCEVRRSRKKYFRQKRSRFRM